MITAAGPTGAMATAGPAAKAGARVRRAAGRAALNAGALRAAAGAASTAGPKAAIAPGDGVWRDGSYGAVAEYSGRDANGYLVWPGKTWPDRDPQP